MKAPASGLWIPAEIWNLKELSITERVLLALIANLSQGPIGCFASNRYLSDSIGLSPESVKKYLQRLAAAGLLKISNENQQRKLELEGWKNLPTLGKNLPEGVEEFTYPPGKILPPTNKYTKKEVKNRREVKNSLPEIVLPFDEPEFKTMWNVWKDERKAQKVKPYTHRGEQAALHNLQNISNDDPQIAISIIKQSIAQGWRGLFPLKNDNRPASKISGSELRAYFES